MCLQDLLATFPELHLFGLEGSLSLQQRNARESWDDHGIINILWDDHWGYPWKPRMIPPRLGPWFCQKRRRLLVEEYSDFNGVASMATNNIGQSSRANVLCCNCASIFLWKLMFTRLWFARASQPAEGPQETNFNGPWEHSSPSTGCSVPWIILGGDEREIKWNEQKFDSEFYLYIYIFIVPLLDAAKASQMAIYFWAAWDRRSLEDWWPWLSLSLSITSGKWGV